MNAVTVKNLSKVFRQGDESIRAVDNISFTVAPGELVAIVGQSGSGKTTLLNLIGGIEHPSSGSVEVGGKRPDKARLRELASFLGIEKRLKHLPGELSGGQRQRVAIARALINNPVILLADEPTGNLDKKAADEIMELLLAVNRRGNTVLLVTHEQRYADMCGRKIKLYDGKIIV